MLLPKYPFIVGHTTGLILSVFHSFIKMLLKGYSCANEISRVIHFKMKCLLPKLSLQLLRNEYTFCFVLQLLQCFQSLTRVAYETNCKEIISLRKQNKFILILLQFPRIQWFFTPVCLPSKLAVKNDLSSQGKLLFPWEINTRLATSRRSSIIFPK